MATASSSRLVWDPVPRRVEQAIRKAVERRRKPLGIEDVRVEPGEDHDGDPVIYVSMKHRLVDEPIDLGVLIDLERELRELAWDGGERRFVHFRHHFHDDQTVTR
jgi:hypothetical protein